AVISLFLAFGTAVNLSKPWVSNTIKAFITVVRAVPTVLWVLIFAIAAGLGSVAAVIGMIFHSIAYLVKAYSEAFEEVDEGKIEALRASGASYFHILFQVIVPQTKSFLISWIFLRFEINFGVAVAMGQPPEQAVSVTNYSWRAPSTMICRKSGRLHLLFWS